MLFVLNNSFCVDASLNLLTNKETGTQTKLEPRLIEILCILAKNREKLVSREMLISKIWNNYGGAEDGLNQGISFLRKALGDTNKQIIATVPKKGYILHATITDNLIAEIAEPQKEKISKKQPYLLPISIGVFILLSMILFTFGRTEISGKAEKHANLFSQSGSFVSKNWRGKNYKLVFDKSDKIILYENNAKIADSNLKNYEVILQELKDKLASEQDTNR